MSVPPGKEILGPGRGREIPIMHSRRRRRAEEIAQLVKSWLCKQQGLSLEFNPQLPPKGLDVMLHTADPSVGTEGSWGSPASQPNLICKS